MAAAKKSASAKRAGRSAMLGESGFARRALDSYWTQPWVTEALLDRISFPREIHEPACGRGDMAAVMTARGYRVLASDVEDYGYPGARVEDFLERDVPLPLFPDRFAIVTNPPYSHAESFIDRALLLTEPVGGMVAMLLRNEFDSGQSPNAKGPEQGEGRRRRLIADHPAFDAKLTLTRRPRWDWHLPPPATKKEKDERHGPRHNFAWLIWDWRRSVNRPPRLLYAP